VPGPRQSTAKLIAAARCASKWTLLLAGQGVPSFAR